MPRNKSGEQEQPAVQIHYTSQRVGVLIDVQNMYYSAKNLFGAKVNFINVVKGAIRDRNLIRAIAYVVETPQQHEVRFLDALRLQGIELKERDLQVFSSGVKKADWDVGITVDAIRLSDKVDVIVIVSGDGDYIPLVEYLQHKGCKVEVMAFRNTSSSRLVEAADQFIDLAEETGMQYLIHPHTSHGHTHGNGNGANEVMMEEPVEFEEQIPAPASAPAPQQQHVAHQQSQSQSHTQHAPQNKNRRVKRTIL